MNMASTEKRRRLILFALVGVIFVAAVIFVSLLLFGPKNPASLSTVTAAKTDAVKGQAGGAGSAEYNKKLGQHDDAQADEALKGGQSFIPTPVGVKSALLKEKEKTTPPPPPAVAPVRPASIPSPRNDGAMLKRMMEDLQDLDAKLASAAVGEGKVVYVRDSSRNEQATPPDKAAPASLSLKPAPFVADIKPGDLLYAIIETGVNSDVPSAVMATVTSGKFKNAKLLGRFQRFDERLVLAFSSATLPTGERIQLEAYAIDPDTTEASVASSVNTHFFSRWGGLIASAFLEGLGTAKRYSGAQSVIYGGNGDTTDQMVWNTYSVADQAWIAAGKVGEKAGKIFERGFERPPTVYLASGTPVGVLILSVKSVK
jgi:type IV secretory pathway VirB10-like protein